MAIKNRTEIQNGGPFIYFDSHKFSKLLLEEKMVNVLDMRHIYLNDSFIVFKSITFKFILLIFFCIEIFDSSVRVDYSNNVKAK